MRRKTSVWRRDSCAQGRSSGTSASFAARPVSCRLTSCAACLGTLVLCPAVAGESNRLITMADSQLVVECDQQLILWSTPLPDRLFDFFLRFF